MRKYHHRKTAFTLLSLLGLAFLASGTAYAECPQPPAPPSAADMISRMQQDLGLSEEQVTQITPIIENEVEQLQALMSQGDRDRSKMDAIRTETGEKLAEYLTAEQLEKWKTQSCKPLRDGGDRRGPPPEPPV